MTNDTFLDSSILVEYIKGTRLNLLNRLIADLKITCFINETVLSEYLLYFLAINGNAAPRSVKSSKKIDAVISQHYNSSFLVQFSFLSSGHHFYQTVPHYMAKYNLVPNDAIILATCKLHGIIQLASHDSDFIIPCKAEGIELLREEDS